MKKSALVIALTGLFAVTAHAQSNVTLYGVLDAGVSYTNNVRTDPSVYGGTGIGQQGASDIRFASGLMQDDLWGVRGAEDLGSGWRAVFDLENGFDLGNGTLQQGGREFGRNAYVGLSNSEDGTLTLGRQEEFMYDFLSPLSFENFGGNGGSAFAHVLDNDNLDGSFRVDNSIKYTSANYNGLAFGGMYGFSNQAGQFANNRAYSLGMMYENGPLKAALAYTELNNNGEVGGNNPANGAVDSSVDSGDVPFNAQRERTFGGALSYVRGPAELGFVLTDTLLDHATGFAPGSGSTVPWPAAVHFVNYEVHGHYQLTPALKLGIADTYTSGSFDNGVNRGQPKWNQVSLLSDYALSKRTDIYALATYQHMMDGFSGNTFTSYQYVPTSMQGASTMAGGISGATNQVVLGMGMRTHF